MRKNILLIFVFIATGIAASAQFREESVLASGRWVQIAVVKSGIHAITYQDLQQMGFVPETIDPSTLRLFGNGGGMLSENNSAPRIDDLRENAIEIVGGADGRFDPTDLLLFYGEAPDKWILDPVTRLYRFTKHLYADSAYYYLTAGGIPGKRVGIRESDPGSPDSWSYRFDDYAAHELDSLNLIRSGKIWYGETFTYDRPSRSFHFDFPDIDTLSVLTLRTYVAARSPSVSYIRIYVNGSKADSVKLDSTPPDSPSDYAKARLKSTLVVYPKNPVDITLEYSPPTPSSMAWLNFVEINVTRFLKYSGPQMLFRDLNTAVTGKINEYVMEQAPGDLLIWDVTDPGQIVKQKYTILENKLRFRANTDMLREFIAFGSSSYLPVHIRGEIANQNLHALQPEPLLIVTHPRFFAQAEKLAEYHLQKSGMKSVIARTDHIYHEFASGQPDISAIRDFVRMIYNRGTDSNKLKYLLLFGDGSYDPKNRVPGNNNFIPTFQSAESLKFMLSYVSDDFFGILEENEGTDCSGDIEVGIGRFPVSTTEDAALLVDKICRYAGANDTVMGDWRNLITFVADDENRNLHMHQAEELAAIVETKYPEYNIGKIYLDAYRMEKIPAGMRFPDVNVAINAAIEKGTLIMNYTGHGSEAGWSYEQVMTVPDIETWTNAPRWPVMITATCEFSRFDNPERYTAGEMVLVHPKGGVISLYSTTRLALSTANFRLDTSFFRNLRNKIDGEYVKMGDLIRISKNNNANDVKIRNFVLFGDPAQEIAFPDNRIRTVSINHEAPNQADTAWGLSTVYVTAQVEDDTGQKLSGFNGKASVRVFDKPFRYKTLGNTKDSYPEPFTSQNILLYQGDHTVKEGEFSFSFVVPKDVAQHFGPGKISYYATDLVSDAGGFTDRIIFGGLDPSVDPVNGGPGISLYMDTRDFISGQMTGDNPMLIADLSDTDGINYIGLGIGHDLLAVLDGDDSNPIVLNDYYIQALDDPSRGSLTYRFSGLLPGGHTLSLRAWDMFDNSSTAHIAFYVHNSDQLKVGHVENRPNPLVSHTWFLFQPESGISQLDVKIQVFDAMGRPVKTLTGSFREGEATPQGIYWNGTGDDGQQLRNGIYPYRVIFKSQDGRQSHTSRKLVIMR